MIMSETVENFKKEYSEDFNNLGIIPDSLIEKSAEQIKNFIVGKRSFGESKIFINSYYDKELNKEDITEIEGSEKHVDILTVYDDHAVYELIFEYTGE